MNRKLTAILSADVVGYSGLMEADEAGTLDRLKANRSAIFEPLVATHGGRIFKFMGDGALVEFPSAASAIACALAIQEDTEAAGHSDTHLTRLRYRIGVNLGDVIIDGDDIYGDGVNVAARLQALAPVGGVAVSGAVRDLIQGKTSFAFEDLGEHSVKNIARPVHVFAVTTRTFPAESHEIEKQRKPSVCVLPFANLSGDQEQEYFGDGLSEEVINQLAQMKELHVVGRTSSFMFKGKAEDARAIGQKLGVSHVLEGSVRRSGNRLRITAQLVKCSDGFHLFSERFDRQLTDVFEIQDEIALAVAKSLGVALGIGEAGRLPGGTDNVEAYDLMLRARALVRRRQPGDAQRAVDILHQALALDPKFALAWNVLGNALTSVLTWDPPDPQAVRRQIDDAYGHTLRLVPTLWIAREARANQLELQHDWVSAEQENAKSRALAPKSMREPIVSRVHQLALVGRITEAIVFAREAIHIEPMAPYRNVPYLLDLAGRSDEAEAEYQRNKSLPGDPANEDYTAMLRMMARGDHERAGERLTALRNSWPDPSFALFELFNDREKASRFLHDVLSALLAGQAREAGWAHGLAPLAVYFGENELALAAWRKSAKGLLGVAIMGVWHPVYAQMRKLAGFKDLVRELNLVTYWRTTGEWGEFARPLGETDFEIYR